MDQISKGHNNNAAKVSEEEAGQSVVTTRYLIAGALTLLVFVAAVAVYLVAKPKPALRKQQATYGTSEASSSSLVEYNTPFGYGFSYPSRFRFAKYEMQRLLPDQIFVLTTVSEDQEKAYVSVATTTNEYAFFPGETLIIKPIPMSFEEFKKVEYQLADPQWQKSFKERTGRDYPTHVSDIQPISTADGNEGIIYLEEQRNVVDRSLRLTVKAIIPYKPISLPLKIDFVPTLGFYFPVISSGSVEMAKDVLRQVIGTLGFD